MQPFNEQDPKHPDYIPQINGIPDDGGAMPPQNKKSAAAVIAAALSAAASIGGTIYANRTNRQIHREDNAFNASQADLAWWRNLPINQRKQMEAAGFNPNLLTGVTPQAAQAANASGAIPMQNAFNLDPNVIADIALKDAQARNLDAQTDATRSDTELNPLRAKQINAQIDQIYENNKLIQPTIEKLRSEKAYTDQQKLVAAQEVQNLTKEWEKMNHEISEIDSRKALNQVQRLVQLATKQLLAQQTLTEEHRTRAQALANNITDLTSDSQIASYNARALADIMNAGNQAAFDKALNDFITDDHKGDPYSRILLTKIARKRLRSYGKGGNNEPEIGLQDVIGLMTRFLK